MKKIIVALAMTSIAIAIPALPVAAQQQETVPFGCDARAPDYCSFSLFYSSGGIRNFTMRAGERDRISGVVPGRDTYCVSINNPPQQGCARRVVNRTYNN